MGLESESAFSGLKVIQAKKFVESVESLRICHEVGKDGHCQQACIGVKSCPDALRVRAMTAI